VTGSEARRARTLLALGATAGLALAAAHLLSAPGGDDALPEGAHVPQERRNHIGGTPGPPHRHDEKDQHKKRQGRAGRDQLCRRIAEINRGFANLDHRRPKSFSISWSFNST